MSNLLSILLGPFKRHPHAVNIALLALLVSGAVGGGLWVKALQETIARKETEIRYRQEQIDLRIKSIEARLGVHLDRLQNKNAILAKSLDEINKVSDALVKEFRALQPGNTLTPQVAKSLSDRADRLDAALNQSQSLLRILTEPEIPQAVSGTEPVGAASSLFSITLLAVVGALVGLLLFLLGAWKKKKEGKKTGG